jgi:endoglucanase
MPERGPAAASWPTVLAVVLVVVLTAACGGTGSGGPSAGSSSSGTPSASPGEQPGPSHFLDAYVEADGRVLRHDQGNDVVSEGQAYGMLVAELAGREQLVSTIWAWTNRHLQKSNRLLAYHASSHGKVLDAQAAADADTLAAYALLRARGPHAQALHADGRHLAAAVLAHETFSVGRGRLVLAAGPWAVRPRVVNPSYWMPTVFDDLARRTGDHRWAQLAATSVPLVDELTQGGKILPPDWARFQGDRVVPSGQGGGSGTPQYGPDAQRLPLWFGVSCDGRARRLAAAWWSLLQQDDNSSALTLTTSGQPLDQSASAVALVASAAAADAARDSAGAAQLRTGAGQADAGHPTYYGAAWLALAHGLRTGALAGCHGR